MIGTALAVLLCRTISLKTTLTLGLLLLAAAFGSIGVSIWQNFNQYLGLALYCLVPLTAALPNVATYILPTVVFEESVRSTFHGRAAALGKVGALLGAILVPALEGGVGLAWIMGGMSAVCLLGVVWTGIFVMI